MSDARDRADRPTDRRHPRGTGEALPVAVRDFLDDLGGRLQAGGLSSDEVERAVAEAEQHLRDAIDEQLRGPDGDVRAAVAEALRQFGSAERHAEGMLGVLRGRRGRAEALPVGSLRRLGATRTVDGWLLDLRHALRTLRRSPVFSVVVILTLALGIGANTAIFSVVDGVLLESLPLQDADRLVWIGQYRLERDAPGHAPVTTPGPGLLPRRASLPDIADLEAQSRSFDEIAATTPSRVLLLGGAEPEDVRMSGVTDDYFRLLRVEAARGRTLGSDDARPDAPAVAVVSDTLWRRQFGGDPGIVGRSISLDGQPFVVVGVMPPEFPGYDSDAELWTPLHLTPSYEAWQFRRVRRAGAIGRLAPGVSPERARQELDVVAARLAERYPETNEGVGVQVVPLKETVVHRIRPTLLLLWGAVGVLLLIACVNVGNMLMARATSRRRETAVRAALGAGTARLVRHLLTESMLLGLAGGAAGLVLATWGVDAIITLGPTRLPRLDAVDIDAGVLAFTLAVSLAAGALLGLVPAIGGTRLELAPALQGGGGASPARGPGRLRGAIVVAQVALAFTLLAGAGLLVGSFVYLWSFEPGFDPGNLLVVELDPRDDAYPEDPQQVAFFRDVLERLADVPAIESVAATSHPYGRAYMVGPLSARGGPPDREPQEVRFRYVSGDVFRTLGIPMVSGRGFRSGEVDAVIVTEMAAEALWPGSGAVGRLVRRGEPGRPGPWLEVVGVVGDIRTDSHDPEPRPAVYMPYPGGPIPLNLVVRTAGDPLAVVDAVRSAVWALDPDQPIGAIQTMEERMADTLEGPRFLMTLFGLFGAVALILSAVGIFGVASYSVSRRVHEFGVRMALGADTDDVLRLVLGRGLVLTVLGIALGLAASLAMSRFVASLLYGVTATDPVVYAAVTLTLLAVALLAFLLPARRAMRVDPLVALRAE